MMTPAATQPPLLSGRALYCERDDRILFESLDFDLYRGEVLQVRGSNGSGKTTLLRMVCGLNDAFSGAILWEGEPIETQREAFRGDTLYLGHRVGVNRALSPLENLRWACGIQAPRSDRDIEQALSRIGLRGYEHVPCRSLSAGQQQRVSLARLLLSPARLWVLDEPFTTLDVKGVGDLEALLAQHVTAGGAVLVTTHHPLRVSTGIRYLNLDDVPHHNEEVPA